MSKQTEWYGTGSNVKVLTREFERNHPFGEIYPPRVIDALGNDVLQSMLEAGAGRYDHHIETFLHHIRDLRELREVSFDKALDRSERS